MKIACVVRRQETAEFRQVAMALCHAYCTINEWGRKNLTLWVAGEGDAEMCREILESECGAQFVRYHYMRVD